MTERFLEVGRALRRQRRRRRPRRLGAARLGGAAAVRRSQPDADQASAVAAGPDRLTRMPPAADEDFRRPGAPARRTDGPASGGVIEPLDADDAAALALNNAHATELSFLEPPRFARLVRGAFLARRIGDIEALLIAFDQDADYDSPNFLWFRERYPRFVYVDRIVVAPAQRGRSLARRLYDDLFGAGAPARARPDRLRGEHRAAQPRVGCLPRAAGLRRGRPGGAARRRQGGALSQARAFRRSLISASSSCSLVGGAGGGGAASSCLIMRFMPLITRNSTKAMMMKFTATVMNCAVAQRGTCLLRRIVGRAPGWTRR